MLPGGDRLSHLCFLCPCLRLLILVLFILLVPCTCRLPLRPRDIIPFLRTVILLVSFFIILVLLRQVILVTMSRDL